MRGDEGGDRAADDALFVFDAAYAADPYRVHSIVAGALPQIGARFRAVHVFCEGGYHGPRFRRGGARIVIHKPWGRSFLRRLKERVRWAESHAQWTSNVTPPLEPLLAAFTRHRFDTVIACAGGLDFLLQVFRLAHIFATDRMPLLLGVTPAMRARRDDVQDAAWLGASLLCDGELAAATGDPAQLARANERARGKAAQQSRDDLAIPFAVQSPLRFTHVETYPATSLETCPAVRWADHVLAPKAARPSPRDVVLFVRPEWGYCGSGTTFHNLAVHFRRNDALLIDIALWPFADRPHGMSDAVLVAEEQKGIGGALYFSLRRSRALPHFLIETLKLLMRMPPVTVPGQKLLQYAVVAKPRLLRRAMRRVRISHIYLNHFFTYQYATSFIGQRRFFLDTHDIQAMNWVQVGTVNAITRRGDHFHALLRDELRVLARAHRISFVNVDELALARQAIPEEKLTAFIALPDIVPCARRALGYQPRLLMVASHNAPNVRSLDWFLRSVWPLVLAGSRNASPQRVAPVLDICGSIAADFADVQVASCQFHGQVEDLRPFYTSADLVVLPVVMGTGVAIKTVEAILHGRPVVATRHALRGLPEAVVRCLGYVNEPQEFAAAVLRLLGSQAELDAAAARVAQAAVLIRAEDHYAKLDVAMEAVRLPTILRGSGFKSPAIIDGKAELLLEQLTRTVERYFAGGERSGALMADPLRISFDSDPSWVAPMFARRIMHDDDYRIFGYFRDLQSLVLDIGANYGYSVASMFAAGCQSCVLSFEPVESLAPCLAEVVRLNPGRCDYRMTALGAREGNLTLVMPVLNNRGITALTTADERPHAASLAQAIYHYATEHLPRDAAHTLRFYSFTAPVQALDAALRKGGPFGVPTSSIVAAKLDTEGTEAAVLTGARDTLAAHRPLILVEGANRPPPVREVLSGAGYAFAERNGDQLMLHDNVSQRPNGFFVHTTRLEEYRALGLLCA